ncbi:hypothetical protein O6P43_005896 [Quillaja saponaria]|uniref:Uncharacterized protein n=1 Tax=Quillaja saponaria TaxID=32244 RepID=A0AAD7Q726_QUISA|nr:hypothetical protein O6P43_005896 [Quillaja saponaria]
MEIELEAEVLEEEEMEIGHEGVFIAKEVLYLRAASGTTVSHVSDIVGQIGLLEQDSSIECILLPESWRPFCYFSQGKLHRLHCTSSGIFSE